MTDDGEFNPDSITLEDVKELDEGEFRIWTFMKINELCNSTSKIDRRQWWILGTVVLSVILLIGRILVG